jgi:hypothetical protein
MLRRFSVEVARSKSGVAVGRRPEGVSPINSKPRVLAFLLGCREMSSKPQGAAIKAA